MRITSFARIRPFVAAAIVCAALLAVSAIPLRSNPVVPTAEAGCRGLVYNGSPGNRAIWWLPAYNMVEITVQNNSDGQIQFNSSGACGADGSYFLSLSGGSVGGVGLSGQDPYAYFTSTPGASVSVGIMYLYSYYNYDLNCSCFVFDSQKKSPECLTFTVPNVSSGDPILIEDYSESFCGY